MTPIPSLSCTSVNAELSVPDGNASDTAIVAVLQQMSANNLIHMLVYGIRTLNRSRSNYSMTLKELPAAVHFVERFGQYVLRC